jgi:hypothetical protein
LVRLDRFLPDDVVTPAREVVVNALAKRGGRRDGVWHFPSLSEMPSYRRDSLLMKRIKQSREFSALMTERLLGRVW